MSSLEFPIERLLITCARETLIKEWDSQCIEKSERVHSLGWVGQEEESWRKFEINVGDYLWVVGFWAMSGL
jgi:hypothetical protein